MIKSELTTLLQFKETAIQFHQCLYWVKYHTLEEFRVMQLLTIQSATESKGESKPYLIAMISEHYLLPYVVKEESSLASHTR